MGSFLCLQGFERNLRPSSIYTGGRTPPRAARPAARGPCVDRRLGCTFAPVIRLPTSGMPLDEERRSSVPDASEIRRQVIKALTEMEQAEGPGEQVDISPIRAAWSITWSTKKVN